jgi:hypothetical protein
MLINCYTYRYNDFNESEWGEHSTVLPYHLSRVVSPGWVKVVETFFTPNYMYIIPLYEGKCQRFTPLLKTAYIVILRYKITVRLGTWISMISDCYKTKNIGGFVQRLSSPAGQLWALRKECVTQATHTADSQPLRALTYCYLWQSTASQNTKSIHCHCWGWILWLSAYQRTTLTTLLSVTPTTHTVKPVK